MIRMNEKLILGRYTFKGLFEKEVKEHKVN